MLDPKYVTALRVAEAGDLDLPDALVNHWRGLQQLKKMRVASRPPAQDLMFGAAATALAESVYEGKEPPPDWEQRAYDDVVAVERHAAATKALDSARLLAEREIESLMPAAIPAAIKSLQPRLQAVVADSRKILTGPLKGVDPVDAATVLHAGEAARKGYLRLEDLGEALGKLRGTWRVLIATCFAEPDLLRRFGVVADMPDRWPFPEWPDGETALLVWAIREEVPLWLPTVEQMREAKEASNEAGRRRGPQPEHESLTPDAVPAGVSR